MGINFFFFFLGGTTRIGSAKVLVFVAAVMFVLLAGLLLDVKPAHASEFEVNSTQDAVDYFLGDNRCTIDAPQEGIKGICTLRAAIEEANANGNPAETDTINFNIGGSGVKTISPASSLPLIRQPVTIDGYSQPGASENTLAIGNNAVLLISLDGVLDANFSSGLRIQANNSVVRGLSITRFASPGIAIRGPGTHGNTVEGNFVGISPGGQDMGNAAGVSISSDTSSNIIGGTSPKARNIISGNNGPGVSISTSVDQSTTGNKVTGNYIGTTKSGTGNLGNSGSGVEISGFEGNTVGGIDDPTTPESPANIIAFNGLDGVTVLSEAGNSILSNSIFSNGDLGIDLGASGVTPNDGVDDTDTGANNLQNFPVITSAKTGRRVTTIKGTLESTKGGIFTIQFFSNPKSSRNEGKKFVGETTVFDTDGDGIIPFTFRPEKKVKARLFITATATRLSDTSEFSAPRRVRG